MGAGGRRRTEGGSASQGGCSLRSPGCGRLLEPGAGSRGVETNVLALLLELVREEGPFSRIADTLNTQGFRTRRGTKWTEVDVFNLLPRLIDAAPDLRRARERVTS